MKPLKPILGLLGLLVLIAVGTFVLTGPVPLPPGALTPTADLVGSAALDGRTFRSEIGPVGKPADDIDMLVFDQGLFLSTECEARCNFPARPYFVRQKEDGIEFISETRCPNKDSTLVWRGTIEDGTIRGEVVWTSARWYWTFERTMRFEGVQVERSASIDIL